MSVLKVNTLGCHPMLLLKKMQAAGGITVLKEEKRTFSGVDYPYRIVAQVAEGMYLEAHDFIHEAAVTEEDLPSVDGASYPFPWDHTKLEAEESDKQQVSASSNSYGTFSIPEAIRGNGDVTLSLLIAWRGMPESATSGDGSTYSTFQSPVSPVLAFVQETVANFEENLIMTGDPNGAYWAKGSNHVFLKCPERPFSNWPFVIATGAEGWLSLWPASSTNDLYFGCLSGKPPTVPVIASASRIRISASVDAENELVSPSAWRPLPIFTSLAKTDKGLFFETGPAGTKGAFFAVAKIDTSKGNNFNGGESLAVYENYPKFFRSSGASSAREKLLVYGTPSNAIASKTMTAYVATPPVSQDVVVGGPVVSEVYAFDSDEIRGAVKGVLGISENVEVGTMGWLDGKRYRVLVPGRMTQVG